jgi:hypothetical protein
MQMKRILGILLALCFLMSVTAAAVSAEPVKLGGKEDKKIGDKNDQRGDFNKGHYHPGHWEKHREGHREYRNNHWIVVYKVVTVYKNAYWSYN